MDIDRMWDGQEVVSKESFGEKICVQAEIILLDKINPQWQKLKHQFFLAISCHYYF